MLMQVAVRDIGQLTDIGRRVVAYGATTLHFVCIDIVRMA